MKDISRRHFIRLAARLGVLLPLGGLAACASGGGRAGGAARVVVVGGGFGGATCARYLRRLDPNIEVILVERNPRYVTCPFSNLVLGGLRDMADITFDYDALQNKYGVKLVHQEVTDVDAAARKLTLGDGTVLGYDKLVMSPGIDFQWGAIEAYDEAASQLMPHAWKAGEQTQLLQAQLQAMPDGGVVAISAPGNSMRCPPGPYERAALIAHYLKRHKPRSKILILDAKENFAKQALFMQGWKALYGDMISWVPFSADGAVLAVDLKSNTLFTEFNRHQVDVANIIPPQQAGIIAHRAGLVNDEGWCPVEYRSFESTLQRDIHVIGDACIADPMPKSGFAANNQAKVVAYAIAAMVNGQPVLKPSLANTCYSLLGPEYAISVAGIYRQLKTGLVSVKNAGGVSPLAAPEGFRALEAEYTYGWYRSITRDVFG